jgi:hypothetical protein
MKVQSLPCFFAEPSQILAGKVSVLYHFLGRDDIDWHGLSSELARWQVYLPPPARSENQPAGLVLRARRQISGDPPQPTHFFHNDALGFAFPALAAHPPGMVITQLALDRFQFHPSLAIAAPPSAARTPAEQRGRPAGFSALCDPFFARGSVALPFLP